MFISKLKPYCRQILLFLLAVIALAVFNIIRNPDYFLNGTAPGDFSLFSKAGLRAVYNGIGLCLMLSILLGALTFLAWKLITGFKQLFSSRKAFQADHRFPVKRMLLCLLLLAAAALVEFLCSLLIDGAVNSLGIYFNPYRFLLISCIFLCGFLFYLYYKKEIRSVEQLFLKVTLLTGLVFVIGMPLTTNVSWDDQIHYKNAAATSFLTMRNYSGADYAMYTIQNPITYDMSEIGEEMQELEAAKESLLPANEKYIPIYQAIAYLPASAALAVSRVLHLPYYLAFWLGRYMNLITYAVLIFYGIRRLKWGKSILMAVALFPTNIFLATNYSYDYFVTAFSLLGFACLIGELQRQEEKISWRNSFIMIGSLVIGFGPKAIYFPLLLLCLFLPREKFSSEKRYRQFRLLVAAALCISIASFVLPFLLFGSGGNDVRGGEDVNSFAQIKYILTHPVTYTKTLLSFLTGSYLRLDNSTFYTNFMAYLGTGVHTVCSMLLLTLASLLDRNEKEGTALTARFRVTTLLLSFLTICLIATALYVSFTPVGSDLIAGCSPRYLAPLIFPVVCCFGFSKISFGYSKRNLNLVIAGISAFVLCHNIWLLAISQYH